MKKYLLVFALLSLPVLAVETATMTPVAPVPTLVPEVTPAHQVSKPAKKTAKKKVVGKKTKARMECLKGNPKLRLAKNKKKLNRCIKRKSSPLL